MTDLFRLKNKTYQSALKRIGIVRFPLLSKEKIDEIRSYIDLTIVDWKSKYENQFFLSGLSTDTDLKVKLHEDIGKMIASDIDRHFTAHKCIAVIVLIKGGGDNSEVDFHQDLSICNEAKHRSYTLWISLTDSTLENGAIRFLNYSHDAFRTIRAHTIAAPFNQVKQDIGRAMTAYPVKEGEALVWDQAGIHQSPPNRTKEPRLALGVTVIAKETPLEVYHYNKEKATIGVYSVPDNFWFLYADFMKERTDPPSFGTKIREVENYTPQDITRKKFYLKYIPFFCKRSILNNITS